MAVSTPPVAAPTTAPVLRNFPPEQIALCALWFAQVETPDTWTEKGPVGEGESASINVENQAGQLGIAKPGQPKADGLYRAAHEKIAFDLAHRLELPVPPVVLWNRGEDHAANRYLSISARAFPQCEKWDFAKQRGLITEPLRVSAGAAVSAMRVFHTWISDTDRKSDHTYVNMDSPPGQLGVAFIDHACSMSHVWKGENAPDGACPLYMPAPELPAVMGQTADQINELADDEIKRIVARVPATYLPGPQRDHVLSNLLSRKGRLRAILAIP